MVATITSMSRNILNLAKTKNNKNAPNRVTPKYLRFDRKRKCKKPEILRQGALKQLVRINIAITTNSQLSE
ncbi:MAG TPA: hypothetical protein DCG18_03460 [Richelia sp.]|nr:hypothetical protein [Richelia sp.]